MYREAYGYHASNGILFNHESPVRGDLLLGDPRKAWENMGWRHKTKFRDLVAEMVAADMRFVVLEKNGGKAALQDVLRNTVFTSGSSRA